MSTVVVVIASSTTTICTMAQQAVSYAHHRTVLTGDRDKAIRQITFQNTCLADREPRACLHVQGDGLASAHICGLLLVGLCWFLRGFAIHQWHRILCVLWWERLCKTERIPPPSSLPVSYDCLSNLATELPPATKPGVLAALPWHVFNFWNGIYSLLSSVPFFFFFFF